MLDLEKMGMQFSAPPRAASTSAASAGTPATPRQGPVRRACYAADRTGHMILQTLYQGTRQTRQNQFFNRVLRAGFGGSNAVGPGGHRVIMTSDGDIHVFRKGVVIATGGSVHV